MEIPGFYYDKQKNKYFRIDSGTNGQNVITKDHLNERKAMDSIDSYKRLDPMIHLPQTLHNQEINKQMKYNLREEVFRSQLKSLKPLKTYEYEVIDFCGNQMKNICVESVIGCPLNDKIFSVLSGDSGSVVHQISVEDVFKEDFDLNDSKHLINCFPPRNRVIDISYINGSNGDLLSTLVHHFPNKNAINTSFTLTSIKDENEMNPNRQVYEFSEPLFSATHFNDMNVLGGEKQIYVFKPSYSGNIQIIKTNGKVTALKTSNDGKFFIAGTNKGQLSCFDIRENNIISKRSCLSLNGKSIVYLHILNDNNSVITSCHNNNISLVDLRMTDKPVFMYLNHVNGCKKIPLNVDESVGIMCSSGDDNLVRFWSIKSPKLLHMYCPINTITDVNHNYKLQSLSQVCYSHSWKCLNKQFKPFMFSLSENKFTLISNNLD